MASKFYKIGANITGSTRLCFNSQLKLFKHYFGMNPYVCAMINDCISKQFNVVIYRMQFLRSLYFLCYYPKVKMIHKVFEVDVKTFRKHTSKIILYLKELNIVSSHVLHII